MIRRFLVPVMLAAALAAACSPSPTSAAPTMTAVARPSTWSVVESAPQGAWSRSEAAFINDALYLVSESLPANDARRSLMRTARYLPRSEAKDAPWPEGATGVFSWRTGDIYLGDLRSTELSILAATLAHELHHMELDRTETLNRMHECDRERRAHAREADDVQRIVELIRARNLGSDAMRRRFEESKAVALSLAALYTVKFELFRLMQAFAKADGLPDGDETRKLYERCVQLADRPLKRDLVEEAEVLKSIDTLVHDTMAGVTMEVAIRRARAAVDAWEPLNADVNRFRGASRR